MIVSAKYMVRYFLDHSFRESTKHKRHIVERHATSLWPDDRIINVKLVDITDKGSIFLVYHKPIRIIMRPSYRVNAIMLDDRNNEVYLLPANEARRYICAVR